MSQLPWFDGYSGQSTAELIALAGTYRADSLVVAFEEALDRKAYEKGAGNLTEEERIVLAVEALEREVNNGGFSQFFVNSSKEYADVIAAALRRIGKSKAAALCEDAIRTLGIDGPLTVEAIDRVMAAEDDSRVRALAECDARYFSEAGDLSSALLAFIQANADKITLKE